MKPIILMAPPQGGKGTIAKWLVETYNIPHISTGDMFKEETESGSERGKMFKEIMDSGNLIPDELTIEMVIDRISKDDCRNGFILDGFPRTLNQAKVYKEELDKRGLELGYLIELTIPWEVALERVAGRVICPECGSSWNTNPESIVYVSDNICPRCNHELTTRADDNPETLKKRFDLYFETTKPILEYYEQFGKVYHFDNVNSLETLELIKEVINEDK